MFGIILTAHEPQERVKDMAKIILFFSGKNMSLRPQPFKKVNNAFT